MADLFYLCYITVTSPLVAALTVALIFIYTNRRRKENVYESERADCIARISEMVTSRSEDMDMAAIERFSPSVIAEAVAFVADNLGTECSVRLGYIADRFSLHVTVLKRVAMSAGYRRAFYLALLSKLPSTETVARECERYICNDNRFVAFYAFMATLSFDSSLALRRLADMERKLAHTEIAEMMVLLRKGVCPIAYTPLLKSGNHNLVMFGIYIVRQFGMTDCERALIEIMQTDSDTLRTDAVLLIATLGGDVAAPAIRRYIRNRPARIRRSIYRHFAVSGYSATALAPLFRCDERLWFETVLKSHKRTIV